VNDIVHVSYDPADGKVEFINVAKNNKDSIVVKTEIGNPLHACVIMVYSNDEV